MTTATEHYSFFINEFYNSNIEMFNNLKIVRKDDEIDAFSFIPENKNEYSIVEDLKIINLTNQFIQKFLMDDSIVFELNNHLKNLNGKKLSDCIKEENSLTLRLNQKLKLIISIDLLNLHIQKNYDPNINTHFKMFYRNTNVIELTSSNCYDCEAYLNLYLDLDKKVITTVFDRFDYNKPCVFKKSPSNIKVKLKVPSKKLVFLNDPRSFLELKREDKASINSLLGCIKETEMYAVNNVGFFFIGNSGPKILYQKNKILISSYDDSYPKDILKFKDYENKGYICADFWWYTVLDYDLYQELCSKNKVSPNSITHTVVDIEKEKCTITHKHKAHKNGHYNGVFSKIVF